MRRSWPTLLVSLATLSAQTVVRVELIEDKKVSERYTEPYMGFVRTPIKYSPAALPLDRKDPFELRAVYEAALPAGEYRFRLRARGAAQLEIDSKPLASTKPQPPNKTGDDPVPPPEVRDESGLRPAPFPHQDATFKITLDGAPHTFLLTATIGGKGLMPTPGELAVTYARANEKMEHLLGPAGSPALTDDDWAVLVAKSHARHDAMDRQRRKEAGVETAAKWTERHTKVRDTIAPPPTGRNIDFYINAKLKEAAAKPTGAISDLEFLRRVSLDITGLIPTPEEVRAYLAEPQAQRRIRAIDRLLANPSWADHWVSYWQDVLAENPGILKPDLNNTGPFRYWLYQSFQENMPFDRMAAELVEMEGSPTLGGPAAFAQATLNDAPMAAKADIVAQAFLGQKLGCARCHDAPFHPFQQKDLFSLAAMLGGKPQKLPVTSTVQLVEGARVPMVKISLKAGEAIAPDWPFKKLIEHSEFGAPPSSTGVQSRRELASLIVSPENGRFAQVVVNRVWKRYMGQGIVEPADDWSTAKPSHPELLDYLAKEFMRNGYDMKQLARTIFLSEAYQRKAEPEKTRLFAGPVRHNMTAEQLVDSLHLAVGKPFDCEEMNLNPAGDRAPSQFLNLGRPERGWQLTALSNERDRPALALPIAQSLVDVMTAYGWRQSRQNAATTRDDAPSPMQTLILANGILGTRIVRLSDDSSFTAMTLKDQSLEQMIDEMFVRILTRPARPEEQKLYGNLLRASYATRKVSNAEAVSSARKTDSRVSWSNHLSAEATLIRMEEERRLRLGDKPTNKLTPEFAARMEDALWAMFNSPEFVVVP